jgi:two-component system response regulator YesN
MKVLIADDEKLVRFTLKDMLKEINHPIEFVGEAVNGKEMIKLVKETNPDLVFVDINMPLISGIEAMKILMPEYPSIKWIILTGYSEFKYAKQAISLGASEYLLKPPGPDELEEIIKKISNKNKESYLIENKDFENKIISLFNKTSSLEFGEWDLFKNIYYSGAIFIFDSNLGESESALYQLEICKSLRKIILDTLNKHIRIAILILPDGTLASVLAYGSKKNRELEKSIVDTYFKRITTNLLKKTNENHMISVFRTDESKSFEELSIQMDQLCKVKPHRTILGIGRIYSYEELQKENNSEEKNKISHILENIICSYRDMSYLDYLKNIEELEGENKLLIENNEIHRNIINFLKFVFNIDISEIHNKEWINELKKKAENLVHNNMKIEQKGIIDNVLEYINNNFMNDISISGIADKLNLTPNYLSYLFHKKTGNTFLKHLTYIRIENAKNLLISSNLKVQDISKKVGYTSTRYFAKNFKKLVGLTPSEYKVKNK